MRKDWKALLALGTTALAAWIILRFSPVLAHVLFLGFLGVLLGVILDVPIGLLARRMPRWAAFFLVLSVLMLCLAGMLLLLVPEGISQAEGITANAGRAWERIRSWLGRTSGESGWASMFGSGWSPLDKLREEAARWIARAIPVAFNALSLSLEGIATIMMALFLAWEPQPYRKAFLRIWTRGNEERVAGLLDALAKAMRHWAAGTLISMAFIGLLTGLGLRLIGVEGWLALAGLAFLGEFIPYAGPILSALPALAVAFAASPTQALWVGALYLALQQVEGHLIQPLVMRRAVRIPPALLILWQIGLALWFGFIGLILATPILAALLVALERIYVRGILGRETG